LVTVRKPEKKPAKADRHTNHGVLLVYGAPAKHVWYFDQMMNPEKLSTHHTIDEAHYGKTRRTHGPHIIMDVGYEQQSVLLALTTPPLLSRYLLRSRHKSAMPFFCKLIPLPQNEFLSAPIAVIAYISTSDINHNKNVTVTFSIDSFGPSFPETIIISGIHPTLGLDIHYDVDQHHCQFVQMAPGTPSQRLSQWKSRLCSAYILSIDTISVHNIADVRLIISEACSANRKSVIVAFTKDDAPNCISAVGYFNQLRIMRGHIDNRVLAVVHKTITGPKFNRRTLHTQIEWKAWLAAEWIQLENYAKQNMFGNTCAAPIDESVFFWVLMYSIKPHDNDRKKVRGICDGSTRGDKTMIHEATYVPTPQHIYFRLQITLSALLGKHLWQADVTNACAEA
jgi:hypothetical protein